MKEPYSDEDKNQINIFSYEDDHMDESFNLSNIPQKEEDLSDFSFGDINGIITNMESKSPIKSQKNELFGNLPNENNSIHFDDKDFKLLSKNKDKKIRRFKSLGRKMLGKKRKKPLNCGKNIDEFY